MSLSGISSPGEFVTTGGIMKCFQLNLNFLAKVDWFVLLDTVLLKFYQF